MAGIDKAHDGARNVALEGFGAGREEERIVLAPHGEERRFMAAEIGLEGRIERDIAFVVAEKVELNFVGARPGQIEIIERIAVRRHFRQVRDAVRILPDGGLRLEESPQSLAIGA